MTSDVFIREFGTFPAPVSQRNRRGAFAYFFPDFSSIPWKGDFSPCSSVRDHISSYTVDVCDDGVSPPLSVVGSLGSRCGPFPREEGLFLSLPHCASSGLRRRAAGHDHVLPVHIRLAVVSTFQLPTPDCPSWCPVMDHTWGAPFRRLLWSGFSFLLCQTTYTVEQRTRKLSARTRCSSPRWRDRRDTSPPTQW